MGGLDAFFCYQKGPSTFGMEILSNTKNSRPNFIRTTNAKIGFSRMLLSEKTDF